jgi:hypothetical protein
MKIKSYIKILLPILTIAFIIIFIQINNIYKKNEIYTKIEFAKEYSGIVTSAEPYQSICYIEIDTGVKIMLYFSINYKYKPIYLNRFIQQGDSIYKPKESDSIYIYRSGEKFYFISGELIGNQQ